MGRRNRWKQTLRRKRDQARPYVVDHALLMQAKYGTGWRKVARAVPLLLSGCGGLLAPYDMPSACSPSEEMSCADDTLNDGTGPDDNRQVCNGGEWVFYPSGELWHIEGTTVLCHLASDGRVLWPVERTP